MLQKRNNRRIIPRVHKPPILVRLVTKRFNHRMAHETQMGEILRIVNRRIPTAAHVSRLAVMELLPLPRTNLTQAARPGLNLRNLRRRRASLTPHREPPQ